MNDDVNKHKYRLLQAIWCSNWTYMLLRRSNWYTLVTHFWQSKKTRDTFTRNTYNKMKSLQPWILDVANEITSFDKYFVISGGDLLLALESGDPAWVREDLCGHPGHLSSRGGARRCPRGSLPQPGLCPLLPHLLPPPAPKPWLRLLLWLPPLLSSLQQRTNTQGGASVVQGQSHLENLGYLLL